MARAMFTLARKRAPCVIFVDEVESLFASRSNDSSNKHENNVLTEIMQEWDGMSSSVGAKVGWIPCLRAFLRSTVAFHVPGSPLCNPPSSISPLLCSLPGPASSPPFLPSLCSLSLSPSRL